MHALSGHILKYKYQIFVLYMMSILKSNYNVIRIVTSGGTGCAKVNYSEVSKWRGLPTSTRMTWTHGMCATCQ
jgi:hypothetical protein